MKGQLLFELRLGCESTEFLPWCRGAVLPESAFELSGFASVCIYWGELGGVTGPCAGLESRCHYASHAVGSGRWVQMGRNWKSTFYSLGHISQVLRLIVLHVFTSLELLLLVAQSCPTLCDPVVCSLPGSSVHGIFRSRILEWVAMPFSRGSS